MKEFKKCSVDGCENKSRANGLCQRHYHRVYRNGILESTKSTNTGFCVICNERPQRTMNMCDRCYQTYKYNTDSEYRRRRAIKGHRYRARKLSVPSEPYTLDDVMRKTGGLCGICGKPIDLSISLPKSLVFSFDHIKPLSKGGSDLLENIQPAHFGCNASKSNKY